MAESEQILKANACIAAVRGKSLSTEERCSRAIELAALILVEAQATQTASEKRIQAQLARMMSDPIGKAFTTSMTDQCFRSENVKRVANQLVFLIKIFGIPHFLSYGKKLQLWVFNRMCPLFPNTLVRMTKRLLRKETASVILPGEPDSLIKHMERRRKEGVRINLNHLGEAILGEQEAQRRLRIYLNDLENPNIEYISVKISTICSQLNLLDWKGTVSQITERLKQLYRCAEKNLYHRRDGNQVKKFVNLDMEEYRDLHLTVEAFRRALDDPEFKHYSAGIVLQSYIPDSYPIQQSLTTWARERVAQGGAPIKIRIVKGANLGMERVEASLRGWPQAPYATKAEVDANFKRMIAFGCDRKNATVVSIGIASHNLFDIAYALLLRSENKVEQYVCFEMLEGMADHMRRVVQRVAGDMLLYCPAATQDEFQYAVAYLVRRLDENTAPENFLRYAFGLHPGTEEWQTQSTLFARSCQEANNISYHPRRSQDRSIGVTKPPVSYPFENEADTDWTLLQNRVWAEDIVRLWNEKKKELNAEPLPLEIGGEFVSTKRYGIGEDPAEPGKTLYRYALANENHINHALETANKAFSDWRLRPVEERSSLLAEAAHQLRCSRADLIGAMLADTGKTIPEADVEISEAIDFAEYYRRNMEEIASLDDIQWCPKGTVLVAPPWNFPCSIPAGGILAALAAGNCVLFKPASEAVLVGWYLVQALWKAGISKEVLQFITCEDEPVGTLLVKDPRIACVVLTGATATAKMMLKLRPGIDLIAETGGKNALIITGLSDRDLAIKDLVQSAFGHAGQKCSACSLAICEAEVYDDPHFRAQLRDAAASWRVGSQWDMSTRLNPLIHKPNATLMRALTTLEEGEEWLLEPKQDPRNPNLWSPGIKLGVKPSSFTYQNELFGPVLGMMRAESLEHAIDLANGTPYGLTSGLHSLDEREQQRWMQQIEAGNCYINRGITGAIVQRQPFGGCKASSFGPGAKAGGPNYVMQLMRAQQIAFPGHLVEQKKLTAPIQMLTHYVNQNGYSASQVSVWEASVGSYTFYWNHHFSHNHDLSGVLGQDNVWHYIPHRQLLLRVQSADDPFDLMRAVAAATICNAPLDISGDPAYIQQIAYKSWLRECPNIKIVEENEDLLIARLVKDGIKRVRFLSPPSYHLQHALAHATCSVVIAPVLANGRIELLHYIREVSLSIDYHRYGYLGLRE
jgi:RHH-type proline utilization regulon transcriptional repressor/proline dehydrogenase/delta 1-pyrroline-5-carboxylate dehydrogenase